MQKTFTKSFLLFILCCFLGFSAWAQNIVVKGRVISADDNQTIPGASVAIKGAGKGTATGIDGAFSISVEPGTTLVISFIGYKSEEVVIETNKFLSIKLQSEAKELKEVTVGYGRQPRRQLTGAVTEVNSKAFEGIPTTSFEQSLQGKAPGLLVTQSAGVPGAASRIRLRGGGAIGGSGEPLVVVDGMILSQGPNGNNDFTSRQNSPIQATNFSALSNIDQNDIENVTILRDASATAIYGSRGANGVILITTKTGKAGKPKYSFNYYSGVNSPTRRLPMLNGSEWLSLYNEARQNDGLSPLSPNQNIQLNGLTVNVGDLQRTNTDWVDLMLQNGRVNEASLNVSGGNENTSYLISGSALQNEGMLKTGSFERFSVRANINQKTSDFLNLSAQQSITYTRTKSVPVSFNGGFGAAQSNALPVFPVFNSDGSFFGQRRDQNFNTGNNPIAQLQNDLKFDQFRYLTNLTAKLNYAKGLYSTHSIQADILNLQETFYFSAANRYAFASGNRRSTIAQDSVIPLAARQERSVLNLNTLTSHQMVYEKVFAEKHSIKLMGGVEYNYNWQRDMGFFPVNGNVGYLDPRFFQLTSTMSWAPNADSILSQGPAISGFNSRFITAWSSTFARFNYAYAGKYLLDVSFRRDGSSNFGPNRRFGNFGAVGAGWIISDEDFWQNIPVVNFAKLRASFGSQGNPGFATSQWNASFGRGATYLGQNSLQPVRLFNPDLSWSTVYQTDVALEFGLWNSKVTGAIGFYERNSTDILFARPVQISGTGYAGEIFVNDPESRIRDRGIEFNFSSTNLEGKFRWTTDFNIASNVNKVVSLGDLGPDAINAGPGDARILLGQPQGIWFLAEFAGVNPETGQEEIFTLNGERVAATQESVRNNRKPMGSPFPKAFGGFGNNFYYKGFDLNVFFTFTIGQDVYDDGAKRQVGGYLATWNQRRDVLDRWQRPGDVTDVPRLTLNTSAGDWNNTSRWLYDASFLRLRTLQLGYTIPKALIEKTKLSSVRVYVAGQNLLTFTTFPGWDPEVTRATEDPAVGNVSWGSPYLATPQMRTITAGINIGF